jgi:hypothetical protein
MRRCFMSRGAWVIAVLGLVTGVTSADRPPNRKEHPKVLTDEAEMIRYGYQKLEFDLKRDAVVRARRDRVRAERKAQEAAKRGDPKSAAPPAQPSVQSVPVIELGPVQTGRVGDILGEPYRDMVTVPVGKVPAAHCGASGGHSRETVTHTFCKMVIKEPDADAPGWKTVSDALDTRIGGGPGFLTYTHGPEGTRPPAVRPPAADVDRAYRALTYASFEVHLRWGDVDRKYKALAVFGPKAGEPFGPKTPTEPREFYVLDPVLGFNVPSGALRNQLPPEPEHILITGKIERQPGEFGIPGDAAADTPICSSDLAAMLCHGNVCCADQAGVHGECCWLKPPYVSGHDPGAAAEPHDGVHP